MKYIFCILIICLSVNFVQSQEWVDLLREGKTLVEVEKIMSEKYNSNSIDDKRTLKHFYRWHFKNEEHFNQKGNIKFSYQNQKTLIKRYNNDKLSSPTKSYGHWEYVMPPRMNIIDEGDPAHGVVFDMYIDETNSDMLYAGTQGGLFRKNTDTTWTDLTHGMPINAVAGVVAEGDVLYFVSGCNDEVFRGIYKSTDAGVNWELKTVLNVDPMDLPNSWGLIRHPTNLNIQFAMVGDSLYKTQNGWDTFQTVIDRRVKDVEFHPSSPNIIYAAAGRYIYKSHNTGASFYTIATRYAGAESSAIAICPSSPNDIFISFKRDSVTEIFHSINSGNSFVSVDSLELGIGQVSWNYEMVVDPNNCNDLIIGANRMRKYVIGGTGIPEDIGGIGIHADAQDMFWHNDTLYVATDGGISWSDDPELHNWDRDINDGLNVSCPIRFDVIGDSIVAGFYHNGIQYWEIDDDLETTPILGGDGIEAYFHSNGNIYSTLQYDAIWINDDTQIPGPWPLDTLKWYQPTIEDPADEDKYFFCSRAIYSFDVNTEEFTDLGLVSGVVIHTLGLCDGQPTKGYFTTQAGHFNYFELGVHNTPKSDSIHPRMNLTRANFLTVDENDPLRLWYTQRVDSASVFVSIDGANNWTDITGNLPPGGVRDLIHIPINNQIYIAHSQGVFYTNDDITGWIKFSNELGYDSAFDLNIEGGFLYCSFNGTGIWRSLLFNPACYSIAIDLTQANDPTANYPGYRIYESSTSITSERIILGKVGTNIRYSAGDYIKLTEGFHGSSSPTLFPQTYSKILMNLDGCSY